MTRVYLAVEMTIIGWELIFLHTRSDLHRFPTGSNANNPQLFIPPFHITFTASRGESADTTTHYVVKHVYLGDRTIY